MSYAFVILSSANSEYRVAKLPESDVDILYAGIDESGKWKPNSKYIHEHFDSVPVYENVVDLLRGSNELAEIAGTNAGASIIFLDKWDDILYTSL